MSARKRKSMGGASASPVKDDGGESSSPTSWTPPTEKEFMALKRYKSFLLPPSNSYAVGQFVWMDHEQKRSKHPINNSTSHPPPSKKARTSLLALDEFGHPPPGALDAEEPSPGPLARIHEEDDHNQYWNDGYWIGKIIEIRARDTSFVWMKIRWMCRTITECKETGIKTGLPRSKAGPKEIFMLGPEMDGLQPVGAVEGPAPVVVFDERNPMQAPFARSKIFLRSEGRTPTEEEAIAVPGNVEPSSKKKARASEPGPSKHLFPLRKSTCYCGDPYRPPTDREEPMALCAHRGCLKWFHLGCLDWKNTYRREATPSLVEDVVSSGVQLMSLLPEYGLTTPAETIPFDMDPADLDFDPIEESYGIKKEKRDTPKKKNQNQNHSRNNSNAGAGAGAANTASVDDRGAVPEISKEGLEKNKVADSHLPNNVLRVAEYPIVRGTSDTGIVGNARYILRARQIVLQNRKIRRAKKVDVEEVDRIEKMIREWMDIWEVKAEVKKEDGVKEDEGEVEGREVTWLCPNCRRAI
uniref:BAH domain-containing protein n=1 Tax=Kwoniella bestiolae CBS 10118 TaxID=1296100 RepID=A0A1B9GG10_9TREE|nr:hypothetical protein I302_01388 [Kwoniella bestiolae CBS 10118]OCF29875.1 hypothetical protein I302_01388 [Kwoniella bestiolae CBS 10118]